MYAVFSVPWNQNRTLITVGLFRAIKPEKYSNCQSFPCHETRNRTLTVNERDDTKFSGLRWGDHLAEVKETENGQWDCGKWCGMMRWNWRRQSRKCPKKRSSLGCSNARLWPLSEDNYRNWKMPHPCNQQWQQTLRQFLIIICQSTRIYHVLEELS